MNTRNAGLRKAALLIAVVINIGLLVVFKYTDMILRTINQLAGTQIPMTEIALPIGISFFTFQALSYVIDVYRDEVQSQKSVFNVMLYVSFFPQLIAGPIVKYHDIEKEIDDRTGKESVDFKYGRNCSGRCVQFSDRGDQHRGSMDRSDFLYASDLL